LACHYGSGVAASRLSSRLRKPAEKHEWGFLEVFPITGKDSGQIVELLKRYARLRPQFADATLGHLANRENIGTIFTLDRRDFSVYRSARKRAFRILPE
jgi:predicted nucleic acid-binding protein